MRSSLLSLSKPFLGSAGLLLVNLLIFPASLSAATITLSDYTAGLDSIRASLRAGRYESARSAARELIGARVEGPGGAFEADQSLLAAIVRLQAPAAGEKARTIDLEARLAVLADQRDGFRGAGRPDVVERGGDHFALRMASAAASTDWTMLW